MCNFATLVLYERHGHVAIGYRAETIDQIARGDVAEGTRGAWELRCWTPAAESPVHGVRSGELIALVSAVFRTIEYCLDDVHPLDSIQRFHCPDGAAVVSSPESLPLAQHLAIWSRSAALNAVFLQTRHISAERLLAIRYELQQEISVMGKVKDELFGRSHDFQ